MTRLADLSCGALMGLLQNRRLADAAGTPPGQHEFLAIRVDRGEDSPVARYPAHVMGADAAYDAAEAACEKVRVPRSPGVRGVNAYVLEVYAPEDEDEAPQDLSGGDPGYRLISKDGHVILTLETVNGIERKAAFDTIADAEMYITISSTIDPVDRTAGRYGIDAPHGLGDDDEAVPLARELGFDVFYSMGGAYWTKGPHGSDSQKWSKCCNNIVAAAFAAISTVEP